ncbi:MAG: alpha-glucosidase/alpha-galactosidase [Paracoccaceae bacterium]|nr:alpha-glucosidase/alpha-galactosidase [Paracoccaceae bacterium]MDE2915886.1 alpha-glucosidase/alpha-galactosidase [Paracoccaceae bacterium]
MTNSPKITFIGAGSTVFLRNLIGDVLMREELQNAHIALMDIDPSRLDDAYHLTGKIISTLDVSASVSKHLDQREALDGADFVIVAFQIGGYEPCTVNDFEIPKKYGLRQTIGDTLGVGGIMRGIRTVPHLLGICRDMTELCPEAIMLQYVNPMVINCWALSVLYPKISVVGLCHSVQWTVKELANDLDIPIDSIRYQCAGINHMAFFLRFEQILKDGSYKDLYPSLVSGFKKGMIPKPNSLNPRCPNIVRYEMLKRLGYFVTESSEHFAEYVPWFIKNGRSDLIEKFHIPLDEYLVRCEEQIDEWQAQSESYRDNSPMELSPSHEYASDIINSLWGGAPAIIYGNVPNNNLISNLPDDCVVEVPCLIDRNGIQPVQIGKIPMHLAALMKTNINVQELTVRAIVEENREHIFHAAMMDPHTAAELDLQQIWDMVNELLDIHGEWIPEWARG